MIRFSLICDWWAESYRRKAEIKQAFQLGLIHISRYDITHLLLSLLPVRSFVSRQEKASGKSLV
jgi:hypothetical protein